MTDYPRYLEPYSPPKGEIDGSLKLNRSTDCWELTGNPAMLAKAKQVFQGISKFSKGVCKFPRTVRCIEDLNWFLVRYIIEIQEKEEWEEDRKKAIELYKKRTELADKSLKFEESPTFKGELMPFQRDALAYLIVNKGGLVAYEMGLGKTPISLAYLMYLAEEGGGPFLIVVQPHLILQWISEIKKFWGNVKIHVIKGLTPYPLPPAHIYITHYGLLRGWENVYREMKFKCTIFDEIQELRRHVSQKYSVASVVAEQSKHVVGLSGTPIYNYGGEIWNIMNILEKFCLGPWEYFTREWCEVYGSSVVTDPELLGKHLEKERLIIRRKVLDVLENFPEKRRVIHQIGHDKREYERLINELVERIVEIPKIDDHLLRVTEERQAFNAARQITGIVKAPFVCRFVKGLLDAGECVILYAHHHKVVDICLKELKQYNPVVISGRQNAKQKNESQKLFMEGKTDIIIVSLRSATGLNLQRGHIVVFLEIGPCPPEHSQAEGRAWRIGQKETVIAYYMTCNEGTDPVLMDILGKKISQFVGVMRDEIESEEKQIEDIEVATEHMTSILQNLAKKKGVDYKELKRIENEKRRVKREQERRKAEEDRKKSKEEIEYEVRLEIDQFKSVQDEQTTMDRFCG